MLKERFLNDLAFQSLREECILASRFQKENKLGPRGSVLLSMHSTDNSTYEKPHLPGHSLKHGSLGKHLHWRKEVQVEGR